MNQIWCIASRPNWIPTDYPALLAQIDASALENSMSNLGPTVLRLLGAVVILILFWVGATIVASVIKGLLNKTEVDEKIAHWVTGTRRGEETIPIGEWFAAAIYWVILLLGLVAFLNALNLQIVSEPINQFLGQIFSYLPKLGGAALLLGVAWALATVAKGLLIRGLQQFRLDDRLSEQSRSGDGPFLVNETLANALYWFIFLFFLPLILDVLDLQGPLKPVQDLLGEILSYIPNIITALIIGTMGWFVARIVRGIVTNLLAAGGADRIGERIGLNQTQGMSLSGIVGTIAYVFMLIPITIAALNALQIEAISVPAVAMLQQILSAIPKIFTASIILVVFYIIGRYVADFVTSILTSLGFDGVFGALGLPNLSATNRNDGEYTNGSLPSRTPSELVGIVVWIGIMLFAVVAAVEKLEFEILSVILSGMMLILGRILAGAIVFAIGLYLANLAYRLIASSGTGNSVFLAQATRVSILVFVAAMALQQMGIAPDIVNLAFGLLLGAIAVAIALSFGLGGRDIAAEQIREMLASFKSKSSGKSDGRPVSRSNADR
jgi:hypothetical protein